MEAVGVDHMEIEKTEAEYRRRDSARLKIQRDTGDLRAARETMFSTEALAAALVDDIEKTG
jgi:CPA2 family monovalent cation:H+ antiporter-2/glutathione-regulated potassium-efflux system protein KefB